MTSKPVILRTRAASDVDEAADFYFREADEATAMAFVNALETLLRSIARNPGIGSPRYAHDLDLQGLRSRKLKRYPYLAFYIEQDDHIDIWRVLHATRDIPAWLHEPAGDH